MKESAEEELSSALKNTSTNSRLGGGTSDTLWKVILRTPCITSNDE